MVGSIFALSTFSAVGSFLILGWPVWAALSAAILTGLVFGSLNGLLVGYLRLRAFLTTLVTFIIGRALFDILVVEFAAQIQLSTVTSDAWDFTGDNRSRMVVRRSASLNQCEIRSSAVAARTKPPGTHMIKPASC